MSKREEYYATKVLYEWAKKDGKVLLESFYKRRLKELKDSMTKKNSKTP